MKNTLIVCLVASLAAAGCKTTDGDQEEQRQSTEESASEATEPTEGADDEVFAGCEITQFTSGWIEASCDQSRFLIQPDLAALATIEQTWSTMSKALAEEFTADVAGEEFDMNVDDDSVMARSFTVTPDESGEPVAKGVYALWDMGSTAKMGAACIQQPDQVNRAACEKGFASLRTNGIPGNEQVADAADSGASIVLAGQPIVLGDDCEVAGERKVRCESGELTWFQGSAKEAKSKSEKALADMKNIASAGGADVTENQRPCTIGERKTTCSTYEISSDAQQAVFHSALVDVDGETLAVACWYDASDGTPSACEAIFGTQE